MASIFCDQIAELMQQLAVCTPYFVRCVKPNETKSAASFDGKLVLNQLRYLGVIETVRIRRQGYPVRRNFQELVDAYEVLERRRLERLVEKGTKASYNPELDEDGRMGEKLHEDNEDEGGARNGHGGGSAERPLKVAEACCRMSCMICGNHAAPA